MGRSLSFLPFPSFRSLPLLAVVAGVGLTGLQCAYADAPGPQAQAPRSQAPRVAEGPVVDPPPPAAMLPRMELVDASMQSLPTYEQGGRSFVLGQTGQRYQIHLVNPTASRVEAVVSVDGLDAVDGKPASLDKRGYLVPAYSEVTIDGFRTSLDTVAAFRFSSVRDSYAARTRHARNVGVVGVAFFRERMPPVVRRYLPPPPPYAPGPAHSAPAGASAEDSEVGRAEPSAPSNRAASGAASAPAARPGLGTQFGEARESHVTETAFLRSSSTPTAIAELRYDDREGLLSRGIQLDPPFRDPRDAENDLRDSAQPFPESRFAQPPP
jgi:hypothetical protein